MIEVCQQSYLIYQNCVCSFVCVVWSQHIHSHTHTFTHSHTTCTHRVASKLDFKRTCLLSSHSGHVRSERGNITVTDLEGIQLILPIRLDSTLQEIKREVIVSCFLATCTSACLRSNRSFELLQIGNASCTTSRTYFETWIRCFEFKMVDEIWFFFISESQEMTGYLG